MDMAAALPSRTDPKNTLIEDKARVLALLQEALGIVDSAAFPAEIGAAISEAIELTGNAAKREDPS